MAQPSEAGSLRRRTLRWLRVAARRARPWRVCALAGACLAAPAAGEAPVPAHERSALATEARFSEQTARLEGLHGRLLAALADLDPVLHARLVERPPTRVEPGYQLLPEIVPDAPVAAEDLRRVNSNAYSWPRTLRLIDRQERAIEALEGELAGASDAYELRGLPIYEERVTSYEALSDRHDQIERHVQHNRLWQPLIHRNAAGFARGTELYHAVLEREAVLGALQASGAAAFQRAAAALPGVEGVHPREALEPGLRRRERELLAQIRAGSSPPYVRDFLRFERSPEGDWTIGVTVYSDIEDEAFLRRFEEAVESHWRLRDGAADYRLELDLRRIPAARLYGSDGACAGERPPPCTSPGRGDPVDLADHLARFPKDGAVLTTGARAIHVKGPRGIVLSPLAVAPRTLAHEFGHVLGFRDEYVRGYRDLGSDGYEILEAVPTPEDIMASPGFGSVQHHHFESLLAVQPGAAPSASIPPAVPKAADSSPRPDDV